MTSWRAEIGRWLRQRPWRHRFLAAGILLAFGAPAGYFGLRCLQEGLLPHPQWLYAELSSNPGPYTYMLLSTATVFAVMGWHLGRREDALLEQSQTDPLTGLLNRRAFDEIINAELARAIRYQQPLSLLMIDVDRLKQINDVLGHAAGDRALRAVAHAIRSVTRAIDQPARLGGDEFGIIAPSTGAPDAADLGQRLRQVVAASLADAAAADATKLSVSIGVADLTIAPAPTAAALLQAADEALYEAKSSGRNRVVVGRASARERLSS